MPETLVWKPTPRQAQALIRGENEILFGGARGGGKSEAGISWLLYDIECPLYRALVIRRNSDDLKDWIDRAKNRYIPLGAVFTGVPVEILFPSGAKIRTGHLKDENAYSKYKGHEYQKILIEELTDISREDDYEKLLGSNRSTNKIKPQVFATTNPDGIGHDWVKKRFMCDQPLHGVIVDGKRTRIFIPSLLIDNPFLSNSTYRDYLESIKDPVLRQQWLDGSWEDIPIEGSFYGKMIRDLEEQGHITEVPIESLPVHTAWDLGLDDATAIWFFQYYRKEIRFIDYYELNDTGLDDVIRDLQNKKYIYGTHYLPFDVEVREMSDKKTRKEKLDRLGLRPISVVDKLSKEDGIEAVRSVLPQCWFDKKRCEKGILALRNYRKEFDEKRSVWRNTPYHDHYSNGADAFRMFAVGYRKPVIRKKIERIIDRFKAL
jgi:hypothetical protein